MTCNDLDDLEKTCAHAQRLGVPLTGHEALGEIVTAIFEEVAEENLMQPTFITQYPVEVSPLARKNEANPTVTDRFELYITGREIANAFSELNDPVDQRRRFEAQARQRRRWKDRLLKWMRIFCALEHGMPPAAGEGIGIDRLVMLFTDSPSIRDVILFPAVSLRQATGNHKKLPYEFYIGLRYLRAKRKQAFISVITVISICRRCHRRHGADPGAGRYDRVHR